MLTQEERLAQNVVFGPDLEMQMGVPTCIQPIFGPDMAKNLRAFFNMHDDVYANKENGQIHLFRLGENDPLEDWQIDILHSDFAIDHYPEENDDDDLEWADFM